VLIHLRPESYLVERAIQADLVLGPLDEHDVAVTRATDAFVADRFAGNLHWPERRGFEGGRVRGTLTLQSMRRVGKTTGHTLGTAGGTGWSEGTGKGLVSRRFGLQVWLEGLDAPGQSEGRRDAIWCIGIGGCPYTTV